MATYAIWNNKGGVGKSYLTFQLAAEYARQNRDKKILVIDLCPQANSSSMLLGGMFKGEARLNRIHETNPRRTISGYMEERISSPYQSPNSGAQYPTRVSDFNEMIPDNLYLLVGDELLEIQSSRVHGATHPGPDEAWRIVHLWVMDLITDIQRSWNQEETCVFIDCNPSFTIYTELALTAADRLLIPFSADGSSQRAVRTVLSLIYGMQRREGERQSEFFLNSNKYRISLPGIYMYIGNRLTQMNRSSASAFKTIVNEIGEEIWRAWQSNFALFSIHSNGESDRGNSTPNNQSAFRKMFQYEVNDANTASVVSSALGIPIARLTPGLIEVAGRKIRVNESQLHKQIPNVEELVRNIE